ncbi:hypothetical protein E4U46_005674 [Claviceps purpurea]|nr:hypothetical protein E4U28_005361 [Claviceps purpurea]KAG6294817.1 hypothetical protein E4U46_005674 [Claviceps purpurea]
MTLLNLLDWGHLRQYGLVTNVSADGYIRIHRRLLTDNPDVECSDTPMAPLHSIRTCYQFHFFERIPAWLISLPTLKYMGFSEVHADKIWDAWLESPEIHYCPTPEIFLAWIVRGLKFPEYFTWFTLDRNWQQIPMMGHGIDEETQEEIHKQACDPDHTANCHLEHTSYCQPWLTSCPAVLEERLISRFMYLKRAYHLSIYRANVHYYFGAEIAEPTFPDISDDVRAYPANSVFSRCLAYAERAKEAAREAERISRQVEAEKKVAREKEAARRKKASLVMKKRFAQKKIAWREKVAPRRKQAMERRVALEKRYALKRKSDRMGSDSQMRHDDRRSRKRVCRMGRPGIRVTIMWIFYRRGG